ncbi:MAG: type VI secretion system baseplate subunit TssG [Myxococcota bacterium]
MVENIERFEFAQALRLLERWAPDRAPVGGDAALDDEVVRFRSDLALSFARSDLQNFEPGLDGRPPHVTVNFMGVATPASYGSLPQRYTEEIRALVRDKNTALRDFLDLFNHRLVSLFFRARALHLPALQIERGPDNPFERALAAVVGIASSGLADRLSLPDRALIARAGLLARRPVPAITLQALLESTFELPVEVLQFRPRRYAMTDDDENRLGRANCRLGEDLFLGREITLADARIRLRAGPLDRERFEGLLPDALEHRQLVDLVRLATGDGLDFDLQLVLRAAEVPGTRLGGDGVALGRLGWSSWLEHDARERPADDATFAPVASMRFRPEVSP